MNISIIIIPFFLFTITLFYDLFVKSTGIFSHFNVTDAIKKGVIIAFILFGILYATNHLLDFMNIIDSSVAVDESILFFQENLLVAFLFIPFAAFSEEIFFRGLIQEKLGFLGSVVTFTLLHVGYGSIGQIVYVLFSGITLSYSKEKYGSIYPGLFAHIIFNFFVIFVVSVG